MPTYNFKCKSCDHKFVDEHKMVDDHPTDCPECGEKDSLEQIIGIAPIQFKGGGWAEGKNEHEVLANVTRKKKPPKIFIP